MCGERKQENKRDIYVYKREKEGEISTHKYISRKSERYTCVERENKRDF